MFVAFLKIFVERLLWHFSQMKNLRSNSLFNRLSLITRAQISIIISHTQCNPRINVQLSQGLTLFELTLASFHWFP